MVHGDFAFLLLFAGDRPGGVALRTATIAVADAPSADAAPSPSQHACADGAPAPHVGQVWSDRAIGWSSTDGVTAPAPARDQDLSSLPGALLGGRSGSSTSRVRRPADGSRLPVRLILVFLRVTDPAAWIGVDEQAVRTTMGAGAGHEKKSDDRPDGARRARRVFRSAGGRGQCPTGCPGCQACLTRAPACLPVSKAHTHTCRPRHERIVSAPDCLADTADVSPAAQEPRHRVQVGRRVDDTSDVGSYVWGSIRRKRRFSNARASAIFMGARRV